MDLACYSPNSRFAKEFVQQLTSLKKLQFLAGPTWNNDRLAYLTALTNLIELHIHDPKRIREEVFMNMPNALKSQNSSDFSKRS